MSTFELMEKCFSQFENSMKRAEENIEKIRQIGVELRREREALKAQIIDDAGDHDTCARCGAIAIMRSERCGALTIGKNRIEHCAHNCGNDRTNCRYCGQSPVPVNINTDNDCDIIDGVAICKKCMATTIWNDAIELWICQIHFTGLEE